MNDNKYWNGFYEKKRDLPPSLFASYSKDFLKPEDVVLEIGCGNGRDSFYLKDYCKEVYAVDKSSVSIEELQKSKKDKVHFVCCDVSDISNLPTPSVVYARFFLHSITKEKEVELFEWLSTLPNSTLLLIECRSEKDVEDRHHGSDHFRRLINYDNLLSDLASKGYVIEYSIESKGLSPYHEEDPFLIRVVGRKNVV